MANENEDTTPEPGSVPRRPDSPPAAVPGNESYSSPSAGSTSSSAPYAYGGGTSTESRSPVLSIISLVAGIVGILGIWVVFVPVLGSILGLPIPLAAVILGFLGKKREPYAAKGLWLTGIILGFIGLAAALLALVIWLILFATVGATGTSYNF